MIDRLTIERIKEAADIVDVVSEFVSLKRSGSNYKGLCPFHNDSNPSFYVSPSRGTCHCFTCGEGGDSVGFIMKHEQMNYVEALRWLANRYGIEVKETELTDEQRKEKTEREAMFVVNNWAAEYYSDILYNDVDGRAVGLQYFRQRGFRDDIIRKFRLGFSPADKYAMPKKAKEKGYNLEIMEKASLCYKDSKGEMVDRFSGRAMFPWIGVSGNVVAFGGRVLDSRTKGVSQKYVNSSESPIYKKERELYGLFQAKKAIGSEDCVYMVEGYTDVISMHQCGIENVVANSGTALSKHQIHLLHRFTSNIVLLYDGDAAGIKAALRGTDMLLSEGMNVKVLLLPDGDDPDSFARKHNADYFKQYVEEHKTDFIEFKTRVLMEGQTDPIKRSEAINSIVKSVSVISDPIVRATYIKDCSVRLGINEQTLIVQMNDFIRANREEKRKEEERERLRRSNPDYQAPTAQPVNTPTAQPSDAQTSTSASPQQTVSASSQQPAEDNPHADIPPEAFLPPEAFEPPSSGNAPVSISQTTVSTGTATTQQTYSSAKKQPKKEDVQTMLIQCVVRHGEKIIFEDAELDDGTTANVTVAQYVDSQLAQDNLQFTNPVYNQILAEVVAHSGEENFVAEKYFKVHPDYEVSKTAIDLTIDDVQLSKSYEMKYEQDTLREHVVHLVGDFFWETTASRISFLRTEIAHNASNPEKYGSCLKEYQQLIAFRQKLAKVLGRS
ncbi:MAG: DNA primase [Prevotella sp.]|nr:DNA primase [Prevotella sp.]